MIRIRYDRLHYATEPIDLPTAAADALDRPSYWQWPMAIRWYLQGRADNEREWIALVEACNAQGLTTTPQIASARRGTTSP